MRYQVFDNGKPADSSGHKVHPSWNNSIFPTYHDAVRYVVKWLGWDWCSSEDDINSLAMCIRKDIHYDYSGYGDVIEIRDIKENEGQ
jgi:hypothetical protein